MEGASSSAATTFHLQRNGCYCFESRGPLPRGEAETLRAQCRTWGMGYSRFGIIAMLLAAEVFVGGAILWAFGGGRGWSMTTRNLHSVSDRGKTYGPIDAGNAPHVVIDDPDSRVVITPSSDGKVHVTDDSRTWGLVWGPSSRPPLSIDRTLDGVSIHRQSGPVRFAIFGMDMEHTEIALPVAAALDIRRCGGADVSGMNGSVAVQSVDGSIHLDSINATSLKIASDDGSLRLQSVQAPSIDASTHDGSIKATDLRVGGGTLHSNDGSIRVALATSNLTVHAQTDDGSIRFNGSRVAQDGDSGTADYQVGTGGGSLQVSTQDGSIHISTNGALEP